LRDIVCLGSIRQGEVLETTAIREIRAQAAAIAELLANDTRERQARAPSLIATASQLSRTFGASLMPVRSHGGRVCSRTG
jgi:hypothetical protein